ncbi:MAG: hypothetical protein ABL921_12430 [Pirellula sp.]
MQAVQIKNKNSNITVPSQIRDKLTELRGLITRFVVSQALIMLSIWLVIAFWAFGLMDYLPMQFGSAESPRIVRMIMLAVLIGISLYLLYRFLWQLWIVRWSDSSLALLIENKHPEFESSLVTTVQAANPSKSTVVTIEDHPRRSSLLEFARNQAVERITGVDVTQLVRFTPLQLQLSALGVLLAASIVFSLCRPEWTLHWAKRFFVLSNDPWPRLTELGIEGIELDVPTFTGKNARQRYLLPFVDGVVSVPKGQACQLKSWANLAGKIVPEVCTVYYRDATGNRGRANMRRLPPNNNIQPFVLDGPPLESVNDSLSMSLAGGDSRISNLQLKSVDAPLITDLHLDVSYPSYLQRSTKTKWGQESIAYRTGARLPQGTQLKLVVQTNVLVSRCEYTLVRSWDSKERTEIPEDVLKVGGVSKFELPLGHLNGNIVIEMRLWGTDGICSSRVQQFVVSAISDQTPQVDLVLQGIGTAVTENAVLPLAGKIKDDYDVKQAWIETVLDENPPVKTSLQVSSDGKTAEQLDLKALRETGQMVAKVGSTIGLTVAAEDFLDLNPDPHIGRANSIQLGVVTPDQLLIVLERRELAMRARLEQIIGEMSQMRDLILNIQKAHRLYLDAKDDVPKNTSPDLPTALDDSNDPTNDEKTTDQDSTAKKLRLQVLRSQQAAAQLTKSEGELRGVEKEIGQINQELINNRIDSNDRRTRLEEKIRKPLAVVLDQLWGPLNADVQTVEKSFVRSAQPDSNLDAVLPNSIAKTNQIISALTAILDDMVDIQDFNEMVDMVRGMIEDQSKVLEKTKQEQKKQLLDLIK